MKLERVFVIKDFFCRGYQRYFYKLRNKTQLNVYKKRKNRNIEMYVVNLIALLLEDTR
jgi:hypothetical protein